MRELHRQVQYTTTNHTAHITYVKKNTFQRYKQNLITRKRDFIILRRKPVKLPIVLMIVRWRGRSDGGILFYDTAHLTTTISIEH